MRTAIAAILCLAAVALGGCRARSPRTELAPPAKAASKEAVPEPLPTYVCVRATSPIRVDGVLDDDTWDVAAVAGPLTQWNGKPTSARTLVRLLWDNKDLYVAFECTDREIRGTMKQRDENLWEQNEVVELFADAGADQGCYLEFEVNPLNTVVDLVIPKAGAPGPIEGKKMWDAKGMKTAVTTDPDGWCVEMAIPLNCFLDAPNTPPKPGDEWRINLYRVDAVSDLVEYQAWSPTSTPEPSFHVPDRFGTLRFEGGEEGGKS